MRRLGVAQNQPAKLAALEGHYTTGPGDLYILGWVNNETQEVTGLKVPGGLSFYCIMILKHR
jgi:cytochrome d ubiquinol oxidase subunit I